MFPSDWLSQQANASPTHEAMIWREQTWTYAELNAQVQQLSGQLAAAGLLSGQRAAVLLPNQPRFVMLIHALIRLGVVIVPVNLRLTREEITWQIEHSRCSWLIFDEHTREKAEVIQLPGCRALDLQGLPAAVDVPLRAIDLDSDLAIIHTSGTTGFPK